MDERVGPSGGCLGWLSSVPSWAFLCPAVGHRPGRQMGEDGRAKGASLRRGGMGREQCGGDGSALAGHVETGTGRPHMHVHWRFGAGPMCPGVTLEPSPTLPPSSCEGLAYLPPLRASASSCIQWDPTLRLSANKQDHLHIPSRVRPVQATQPFVPWGSGGRSFIHLFTYSFHTHSLGTKV